MELANSLKKIVNLMNSIRRQSIQFGGEKSLESRLILTEFAFSYGYLKASASSLSSLSCPPVSLHPDPSLSVFPFGPPLCLPSAFPFSSSLRRAEKSLSTCPLPSVPSHHTQSFPCPTGGGGKIQILRLVFLFLIYRDLELLLCWKHLTAGLEHDSR